MKLRYKLMLAFFLLAVLPLAAITLYSYRSSVGAFRKAVESESGRVAEEMENRMETVTAELSHRIERLQAIPLPDAGKTSGREVEPFGDRFVGHLLSALGKSAIYIDSVEITRAAQADFPPVPPGDEPAAQRNPVVIQLSRILRQLEDGVARPRDNGGTAARLPARELGRLMEAVGEQFGKQAEEISKAVEEAVQHEEKRLEGSRDRPLRLRLKQEFGCELRQRSGRPMCFLKAMVNPGQILGEVFSGMSREQGEIPFALDTEGNLYTADRADLPKLRDLELTSAHASSDRASREKLNENWVIVTREDASTGLVFGLARPVGASLDEIRRASVANLGYGMGMALLALLGILPISRRMTRDLTEVTRGAGQLADGNLDAQLPVRTRDELGQLAQAFNEMARRLKENQGRLLEQERLRKELEMCRQIQRELLPRAPLQYPLLEVHGVSIPARELGGDFFNYFELPSGDIALLMGDVSGKGVPAALLMANLQATLRARLPVENELAAFARKLDHELDSGTATRAYLTLFLSVFDPRQGQLRYVNAGHECPYLVHRDGRLEPLHSTGRPIGLLPGGSYEERSLALEPGDCLFLCTDGLLDAESESGQVFGHEGLESVLSASGDPGTMLARVEQAFLSHRGGKEAPDDAALLVLRVAAPTGS